MTPRKRLQPSDLRLLRGIVVARALSARTIEGCDRAGALLDEWLAAFPDDEEMYSYGSQVNKMRSAIRRLDEHPEGER